MTVTSVSPGRADSQWTTGDRGNYAGYSARLLAGSGPTAGADTGAASVRAPVTAETGDRAVQADSRHWRTGGVQRLLEDGGIVRQRTHRSQADKCCKAHGFMLPVLSSIVAEISFPILKIP